MRVFVAGGTGVIGRRLVRQLVARGHRVTATTTSRDKVGLLVELGAEGVVMDGLDAAAVGEAVASARPEVIVNEMTALSPEHAGKLNPRKAERYFASTNQLRGKGNDSLLAAAEASGVGHLVAQSAALSNGVRDGGWTEPEHTPFEVLTGSKALAEGTGTLNHLEDAVVRAGGAALRYGALYGAGANDDQIALIRKRRVPIIGDGAGYTSWLHVDDAVAATVLAVEQQAVGLFNIVDDEPAPMRDWLSWAARCAGAKPPRRIPAGLARLLAGDMMVSMTTQEQGFSNAKAKRELGWQPTYPSWREGFRIELG